MTVIFSSSSRHSSYYDEVALHRAVAAPSSYASFVDSLIDDNSSSITSRTCGSLCMQHCFEYHFKHDQHTSFLSWLIFWCKAIIRKVFLKYLSHPIYLFLLPLCIGIFLGVILAKITTTEIKPTRRDEAVNSSYNYYFRWIKTSSQNIFFRLIAFLRATLALFFFMAAKQKFSLAQKEAAARAEATNKDGNRFEANVPLNQLPKHVAVIMDGNRRYGRAKYGIATKGHWDGSKKLCEFARWCQCEGLQVLTVYAFSTENWDRDPAEVETLMEIILKYCDEILEKAVESKMKVKVLSTETHRVSSLPVYDK